MQVAFASCTVFLALSLFPSLHRIPNIFLFPSDATLTNFPQLSWLFFQFFCSHKHPGLPSCPASLLWTVLVIHHFFPGSHLSLLSRITNCYLMILRLKMILTYNGSHFLSNSQVRGVKVYWVSHEKQVKQYFFSWFQCRTIKHTENFPQSDSNEKKQTLWMHLESILNMGIFVFFQILQKICYRAVLDYFLFMNIVIPAWRTSLHLA